MTELSDKIVFAAGLPEALTPDQLAALAASRPDLWGQIEQHSRTEPAVRQWILARRAEQWHFSVDDADDARAAEGEVVKKQPRGVSILAVLLIALLALGGTGTALSATGSWPFGPERPVDGNTR